MARPSRGAQDDKGGRKSVGGRRARAESRAGGRLTGWGDDPFAHLGWFRKFAVATRGLLLALRSQRSFLIQIPCAFLALAVAALLQLERWQWITLLGCVATVLITETMNTSIETLARAVTREHDPWIRDALDIAAGAVLLASTLAVVIGLVTVGPELLAWWQG